MLSRWVITLLSRSKGLLISWLQSPSAVILEPRKIKYDTVCFPIYLPCVDHSKLWKILKEMGIPDHLTCLLRNLYAGQEPTVRTGHGTTDWFQIGKRVPQGYILSHCLFNFYPENCWAGSNTNWSQDCQEKCQ